MSPAAPNLRIAMLAPVSAYVEVYRRTAARAPRAAATDELSAG